MKRWIVGCAVAACFVLTAWPQALNLQSLDRLEQKATEKVNVTLDASMLQLAAGFLSSGDPDQVQVKKLVSNLKGIYVRSFEFKEPGQYSISDVDAVRAQLKGAGWQSLVQVRSKEEGENVDVVMRKNGEQITGMAIVVTQPKEVTVVNIVGPINLEDLGRLSGNFGIPQLNQHKSGLKARDKKD